MKGQQQFYGTKQPPQLYQAKLLSASMGAVPDWDTIRSFQGLQHWQQNFDTQESDSSNSPIRAFLSSPEESPT